MFEIFQNATTSKFLFSSFFLYFAFTLKTKGKKEPKGNRENAPDLSGLFLLLFLSSLTAAIRMYITLPRLQAIHFSFLLRFCCSSFVLFSFPRTLNFLFIIAVRTLAFFMIYFNSLKAHIQKKKKIQKNPYVLFFLTKKNIVIDWTFTHLVNISASYQHKKNNAI